MNDGTRKVDNQHQTLAEWASKKLSTIIDFMDKSQIDQFLNQHIMKDVRDLEAAFADLLDMTNESSKQFMHELITRKGKLQAMDEKRKKLEEEAMKKQMQKNKKAKSEQKKHINREMCHCQAMVHDLVSNCTGCGRIICTEEGEGECLF